MTAWTVTLRPAKIALSNSVMFNAAAFEMECAGITGKAPSAANEKIVVDDSFGACSDAQACSEKAFLSGSERKALQHRRRRPNQSYLGDRRG